MIIVSDTGPLRYLVELGVAHVLPALYGTVMTTDEVLGELRMEHFPIAARAWATTPPDWLQIARPSLVDFLDQLDVGEATAISLARERSADAILIDERTGSAIARSVGLRSFGTLAVLQDAGHQGLIDFYESLNALVTRTRFRHSKSLIDEVSRSFASESERRRGK